MTRLRKILKDNGIKQFELYNFLGISQVSFERKSGLLVDFTIDELKRIKSFLVDKGVIGIDFDIGDFLDTI